MKYSIDRLYLVAGLVTSLLFAFITPPFQVPDEVGHFWRSASIVDGYVVAERDEKGTFATVADGIRGLVFVLFRDTRGGELKITWAQYTTAWDVSLRPDEPKVVRIPAGYTPVAYAPQIVGAAIGKIASFRPIVTFYLGRLCNAIAFVLLFSLAIRITPVLKVAFAVCALFPMSTFLAGSWSPDAMTIASAFLLAALLLRAMMSKGAISHREVVTVAIASLVLALCKPAYFLIAMLALAIPGRRFSSHAHRAAAVAVIAIGTAAGLFASMWMAQQAFVRRVDQPVDPAAQMRCVLQDPVRFAALTFREIAGQGMEYPEQAIGRLGLLDLRLPRPMIWTAIALLVLAVVTGGGVPPAARVIGLVAALGTIGGIALSTYIGWSRPCGDVIEGLQGRYFLPVLPMLMIPFAADVGRRQSRRLEVGIVSIAILVNLVSVAVVFRRYF